MVKQKNSNFGSRNYDSKYAKGMPRVVSHTNKMQKAGANFHVIFDTDVFWKRESQNKDTGGLNYVSSTKAIW